ncbi:energy-coupling factor ABC transporter ATP-binding protein [Shewanella benthica]|uniref:ATP/GTP-binding site motif A (P-loop):ABC transporter:AAA ATPase n=1 Tax=Shewanella benthica KT99 TaxID=314608 RepID=A9DDV4_9GAMM|nr:ABC transporter ATP-binding protein [Shewanella benthica]EDQ00178.1 ATP/GTP-binding site motif A (P-loop):ABC transporter:AAA ATPase [Shewanella benthica KT99]
MSSSPPIIELKDVSYQHADGSVTADKLNFSLFSGQKVAISGKNGSGKSTLLAIIMGLRKIISGEVLLFGHSCRTEADFSRFRTRIGLVFQDPDDQLFCPTVIEDVCFGPLNQGLTRTEAIVTSREILKQLNASHLENKITYQLSGGQKRIVALASVLAMKPEVLILDEPSNDLDLDNADRLISILKELSLPMILVSHDADIRAHLVEKEYLLEDGVIRNKS